MTLNSACTCLPESKKSGAIKYSLLCLQDTWGPGHLRSQGNTGYARRFPCFALSQAAIWKSSFEESSPLQICLPGSLQRSALPGFTKLHKTWFKAQRQKERRPVQPCVLAVTVGKLIDGTSCRLYSQSLALYLSGSFPLKCLHTFTQAQHP